MNYSNFTYKSGNNANEEEKEFQKETTLQLSKSDTASKVLETPSPQSMDTPDDIKFILGSPLFIPGYLSSQIGKYVVAEFLEGQLIISKEGILMEVGVNFIILQDKNRNKIVCDLNSLKFINIRA